jgi:hypothetical protein
MGVSGAAQPRLVAARLPAGLTRRRRRSHRDTGADAPGSSRQFAWHSGRVGCRDGRRPACQRQVMGSKYTELVATTVARRREATQSLTDRPGHRRTQRQPCLAPLKREPRAARGKKPAPRLPAEQSGLPRKRQRAAFPAPSARRPLGEGTAVLRDQLEVAAMLQRRVRTVDGRRRQRAAVLGQERLGWRLDRGLLS